jgi:hypothetical protein
LAGAALGFTFSFVTFDALPRPPFDFFAAMACS